MRVLASSPFQYTFEVYLDDDRYAVPTLHLISADDALSAMAIARRMLGESTHHLGAELCHQGRPLAGLGSLAPQPAQLLAEAQGDPR